MYDSKLVEQSVETLEGLYAEHVRPHFQAMYPDAVATLGAHWRGIPVFGQRHSYIHGVDHWARVAGLALAMSDELPTAGDEERERLHWRLMCAALFHDSARRNDGRNPEHAGEGRRLWEAFAAQRGFPSTDVHVVATAIERHYYEGQAVFPGADPVTVLLANADRLDRIRFGSRAREGLMYESVDWRRWQSPASLFCRGLDRDRALDDILGDGGHP